MLKSLQAARAVAALLVVAFHASGSIFALPKYFNSRPVGGLFDFGNAGVDFFFVLSGFIMLYVHRADLGRPGRLPHYLLRRAQRIYPVYWAVLLLVLPVFYLVPSFGDGSQRDLGVVLRSFFLLPQVVGTPVLVVSWSLVFEVFFYLLFGLLLLDRRIGALALAAWLVFLLVRPWAGHYPWGFVGNPEHFKFLAGLAVAEATHRWRIPAPRLIAAAGLTLFLMTGCAAVNGWLVGPSARGVGYALGSALLIVGLVEWERSIGLRVPRLLLVLGAASYSIYLVHFPVLSALAKTTKVLGLDTLLPHGLLYLLFVGLASAAGVLFHLVIERPLCGLGRAHDGARGAKAPAAPSAAVTVSLWRWDKGLSERGLGRRVHSQLDGGQVEKP